MSKYTVFNEGDRVKTIQPDGYSVQLEHGGRYTGSLPVGSSGTVVSGNGQGRHYHCKVRFDRPVVWHVGVKPVEIICTTLIASTSIRHRNILERLAECADDDE